VTQAILTALKALDVGNDNHWTADGLPRLDTVKMLATDQTLTREAVAAAAPGFTRSNAVDYTPTEGGGDSTAENPAAPPAQPESTADQGAGTGEGDPASQQAANADPASTSTQAQPGQVGGGEGSAASEIEALEEELAETNEEVERIRAFLDEGNRRLKVAQERADKLQAHLDKLTPNVDSHAGAIQAYLASQRKQGELRAARMSAIQESGVNLKELARSLKAPIDAAMGRRTERGGQRPTRL
jgi:molecular chaperone GrpE (heat shock protein)